MYIWLTLLISLETNEVLGNLFLTAESPQDVAEKAIQYFKEQGLVEDGKRYHLHAGVLGIVPGTEKSALVTPIKQVIQVPPTLGIK